MERGGAGPAPAASGPEARDPGADDEGVLFRWAEAVGGGTTASRTQTSGGNRARSWAIDVARPDGTVAELFLRYEPPRPPGAEPYTIRREAAVYRAIDGMALAAPRILAEHPAIGAILTTRAHGIAEFRRLRDPVAKQAIAGAAAAELARLHARPAGTLRLAGGGEGPRIADHVRAELATWRAMYDEADRPDPLIVLAFRWLDAHLPDPDGAVALVHGDAGPGNFLFADGRLTALIDWELAHLGDPMEDLAWFSMRCVMEPVPDFARTLGDYAAAGGRALDRFRVLYHRVFVSARVVVIRHRNVTGEPAHAIVSRALNRRLLVEALAEASGTALPLPAPVEAPETDRAPLFARVLDDLRNVVVPRSTDGQVLAKAKNAAKVVKYLEATDRYGPALAEAERAALAALFGTASLAEGRAALAAAVADDAVPFADALRFFAAQAARDALLAAGASGGIAARHYPPLPPEVP